MLYRTLGKTNEKVSALGFGCMRLPIIDGDITKIDEEKATEMIRHAIDEGVNYVDTAYPYHGTGMERSGESEPFVGRALKDGYREKVNLATKLPSWLIKTREDMDKYLNEQLERLQTDKIDFYLVHSLNRGVWENLKKLGIDEFLNSAIKDGRIRYAGFSFHDDLDVFKEIVDYYDWSFCQIQYNYLDENFQAGTEGLKYAADKGLGVVIMEPLRGGKLIKDLPEPAINAFNKAKIKKSSVEWALRWVWNNPEVSVVLSGMNVMEHIDENLKIASSALPNSLTEKELELMDTVKEAYKERTKVNCTGCQYCMPCPAGVNIPKNFTYYNQYHMLATPETEGELKAHYNIFVDVSQRADKCLECGKCESHCPQGIKIRQELKNVKALFA
ncbi:aldo/keto reductase [Clostridium estertheticum]|uniref:aldo/keto reductase n=1 Tax=Clostridium estertheticum TaxID=238834 RepID=UPI001CF28176|nr:aldo/keto reductase [Clostridium estertheticum]MCB2354565.1 aldo/keto reductase [Clostridium estertheticum]MCB2358492.1 aldo/keto reductase [Clostridium estertheticum]WAG40814.1 aldo/keto reductase [Clostridium estertheticum]